MAPRGRGGKFSKPTRGGGKHFSRDLQPLDKDGTPVGMWREGEEPAEDTSSEEEDSSEESSAEEGSSTAPKVAAAGGELTREQRKEAARLKKQQAIARKNKKIAAPGDLPSDSESSSEEEDDDEDMPANPNHTSKARSQARIIAAPAAEAPVRKPAAGGDKENLSRREREALQAQQARERYQKLHAEGKTDEARADLARLRLVKERREAESARKQAEKEEREEREKENKERAERENKLRTAALGNPDAGKAKKTSKTVKK